MGECAWGTQFHIEATREMLLGWLEMGGADLRASGYPPEVFARSLELHYDQHAEIGRTLAARFAALAAARPAKDAEQVQLRRVLGRCASRSHQATRAG